jgi:hypothetical protein
MVDALYYVHETSSAKIWTLLDLAKARRIEITHDPRTSASDVAIQVWLAAPELLRERHAEAVAFRQKNFSVLWRRTWRERSFPNVDEAGRAAIEAALDDWFDEHRRGRDCQLFLFPQKKKVWILVRHGLPMRREASHGEDGASATEFYRPQQHDVLIYDTATDEIAVHANTKGETKLYLATLGRLVFGDENYFPAIDKFSLQPLIDNGPDSVLCQDIDGLEQVRLVEYRRYWGGAQKEVEIRKASDIFEALRGREQRLGAGGRLVGAVFKVRFSDSTKDRSVTIRPPGNAKYERNEDSELIETWLKKRGFICPPPPALMMTKCLARFWKALDQIPDAATDRLEWLRLLEGDWPIVAGYLTETGRVAAAIACPSPGGDG